MHWPLFLPGTPRLKPWRSCHSRWACAHLLTAVSSLDLEPSAVGRCCGHLLVCTVVIVLQRKYSSASTIRVKMKTKVDQEGYWFPENGRDLPYGSKDHSYKIRSSTKCDWTTEYCIFSTWPLLIQVPEDSHPPRVNAICGWHLWPGGQRWLWAPFCWPWERAGLSTDSSGHP